MNESKKKIDVNLSSLERLKAELLRKQEEVRKAKLEKPIEKFVPKKPEEKPKVPKEKGENKIKDKPEKRNFEEYEDSAAFDKAKRVLQAKAKFYDKMVASGGSLNSDDNCLVLFNKKKQNDKPDFYIEDDNDDEDLVEFSTNISRVNIEDKTENKVKDKSENSSHMGEYEATEEGNDWVEYTDCLGRTRKCLRKDFVFCKQRDSELAKNIQPREVVPNPSSTNQVPVPAVPGSMSSLEATVRTKYEAMKENWERKENENLEKEFIHYQDVFFDEARQHGVGYYAFSTDDEERARQLKELYEIRAETLEEQKKREAERQQRDIILSERVRAAENRLRARQGLPPLEDDPAPQEKKPLTKEERKHKRQEEKLKRRLEKNEKIKDEQRKSHIRPWDKQKIGQKFKKKQKSSDNSDSDSNDSNSDNDGEWHYRPKREPMSQEQWNEKQRNTRNPDFAPPQQHNQQQYSEKYSQQEHSQQENNEQQHNQQHPQSTTSSSTVPSFPIPRNENEPSINYEDYNTLNANPLMFTTKKRPFQKKLFTRKNYIATDKDTPSQSEEKFEKRELPNDYNAYQNYDDDIRPPGVTSDNEDDYEPEEKQNRKSGVEIPPPPTFEYYGPTNTKARSGPIKKPDIVSSIEAGLKFLRNQSDKGMFPTKYNYSSTADNN